MYRKGAMQIIIIIIIIITFGALDSIRIKGSGFEHLPEQCVVFLGKTLYPLYPSTYMSIGELMLEGNPTVDKEEGGGSGAGEGSRNAPIPFNLEIILVALRVTRR